MGRIIFRKEKGGENMSVFFKRRGEVPENLSTAYLMSVVEEAEVETETAKTDEPTE